MDNIVSDSGPLFAVRPFRDLMIGEVLFHELGHHIHAARLREFREKEAVAEEWEKRLTNSYMHRHYWYLVPLGQIGVLLLRFLLKFSGQEKSLAKVPTIRVVHWQRDSYERLPRAE